MKKLNFIILFLLFTNIVFSKTTNKSDDLKIKSNKTEIFNDKNQIVFSKNVISTYQDSTLKCDKMIVYYTENKNTKNNDNQNEINLDKIELYGNVNLKNPNVIAYSNKGIFKYKEDLIILKENIKSIQDNVTLYADELTYNIKNGKTNIKNAKNKQVKLILE